jgi:hypothetical protein
LTDKNTADNEVHLYLKSYDFVVDYTLLKSKSKKLDGNHFIELFPPASPALSGGKGLLPPPSSTSRGRRSPLTQASRDSRASLSIGETGEYLQHHSMLTVYFNALTLPF